MTYTIEQLESTFAELEANKGHLICVDIMAALTEDSHVLEVMSQLLDTMRALEAAQMRIEAAAAIEQRAYDYGVGKRGGDEEIMYGNANGWNECWYAFRKALGVEDE